MLAALTSGPSTATELGKRAGLPGRERTVHATCALARLGADGLAIRVGTPQVPRWSEAAPLSHDPGAIPQRDEAGWPFLASGLKRRDRQGQRIDGGDVKFDAAAGLLPDFDRVGDARRDTVLQPAGRVTTEIAVKPCG